MTSNQRHAFTLVETLLVISISTIIFIVITATIVFFYRSNAYTIEQSDAVASGRAGVEDMVSNLREASYSDTGTYPIVSMATSSITFYSDIDRDESVERVRYYLSGTDFRREAIEAVGNPATYSGTPEIRTIAAHVRNVQQGIPIFRYFADDGTQITSMSSISGVRFVQVNLVVNVNPNRLPNEFVIRSSATLRNISAED